ncbi:MAG: HK97 gp10 family phage protein [Clostridia bacterium]
MARWGRCDYRELKKLDERLQQLSEVDMDRLCRDAAKKIAQILLNKVKKRTPVGVVPPYATDEAKEEYWPGYRGGSLRDAWTILPIEKHGEQYTVTIINNLEYASYVEYGHRQTPGCYVPALGKTLKASWVKGRFMLTISEQEVKTLAPSILNDMLYDALKGVFS